MRIGLAAKFLLPVSAWIVIATALLGWLLIERQSQEYMNLTTERGSSLVQFIAHDVWWGTELAPEDEIITTAMNARSWSDFLYLCVMDPEGRILEQQGDFDPKAYDDPIRLALHSRKDKILDFVYTSLSRNQRILDISCPIHYTDSGRRSEEDVLFLDSPADEDENSTSVQSEFAGRVHIGLDLSTVDERTRSFTMQILWLGAVTVALGIICMLLIVRVLLLPLTALRNATRTISTGDLSVRLHSQRVFQDELSELGDSFNGMIVRLKEARQSIELYNKDLEGVVEQRTKEIGNLRIYLQNILDSIPSAVALFTEQFQIRFMNQEFQKTFGPSRTEPSDTIHKHIPLLSYETFREQCTELQKESFSQGSEFHIENKIYFYRLFQVFSGGENQTGIVLVDVTEERQLQRQLTQAEKLAGIGTLASGVAHEINNPLQGILGMAEAAIEEEDPGLVKEYTQDIITYAKQAGEIVKELSTYSRAARSDLSMPLNINTVIKSALRMSQHANNYADVTVQRILEDIPDVLANAGEFQQVFVNLLNNAIQAMNENGNLTLKTWYENHRVFASVTDTGCGIPPQHLAQIFEPFFTTKPPGKGTGLGLNVVYRILEKHHGRIQVESQIGQGTTFTIDLPATGEELHETLVD